MTVELGRRAHCSDMDAKKYTIELTGLQLEHAIVMAMSYMDALLKRSEQNAQGGEHEDYLVAQSLLKKLIAAKGGPL
ncbi:hypothetical protein V8J88_01575 [Massilia sp. W12]|uniref:hypothetical protein n=1 Tax=Massilia sp. W12 TaxID=3126507 RepID=UPI0030CC1B3C